MKRFDRFNHEGVRKDLERIRSKFPESPVMEHGSSSDGEITLRRPDVTAYVRKYRIKEGWRLEFYRSGKKVKHDPIGEDELILLLKENFP